jgi:Na+/proline symporter
MFVGPLAALFFVGMFLTRCTTRSALPAVLCGMTVSVMWSWYSEIFGTDYAPTIFLAIAVPWLTTVVTAGVLSLIVEKGGVHSGKAYTWFAIVRGDRAETPPAPELDELAVAE